jgi:hypothetical protein
MLTRLGRRRRSRIAVAFGIYFGLIFGLFYLAAMAAAPTITLTITFLILLFTFRIRRHLRAADDTIDRILAEPSLSADEAKARLADAERRARELERQLVWRRASMGHLPGWVLRPHLDREFAAYTDCEYGHYDFHGLGDRFDDHGRDRVVRDCIRDDCPSTWTERV